MRDCPRSPRVCNLKMLAVIAEGARCDSCIAQRFRWRCARHTKGREKAPPWFDMHARARDVVLHPQIIKIKLIDNLFHLIELQEHVHQSRRARGTPSRDHEAQASHVLRHGDSL